MKIIVASLLLTSSLSGVYLAKGQRQDYPELQHVRKVYVFNPHKFGYLAPRHIEKGLQKSHCMRVVNNPMQADAILMPIMYQSWLE